MDKNQQAGVQIDQVVGKIAWSRQLTNHEIASCLGLICKKPFGSPINGELSCFHFYASPSRVAIVSMDAQEGSVHVFAPSSHALSIFESAMIDAVNKGENSDYHGVIASLKLTAVCGSSQCIPRAWSLVKPQSWFANFPTGTKTRTDQIVIDLYAFCRKLSDYTVLDEKSDCAFMFFDVQGTELVHRSEFTSMLEGVTTLIDIESEAGEDDSVMKDEQETDDTWDSLVAVAVYPSGQVTYRASREEDIKKAHFSIGSLILAGGV